MACATADAGHREVCSRSTCPPPVRSSGDQRRSPRSTDQHHVAPSVGSAQDVDFHLHRPGLAVIKRTTAIAVTICGSSVVICRSHLPAYPPGGTGEPPTGWRQQRPLNIGSRRPRSRQRRNDVPASSHGRTTTISRGFAGCQSTSTDCTGNASHDAGMIANASLQEGITEAGVPGRHRFIIECWSPTEPRSSMASSPGTGQPSNTKFDIEGAGRTLELTASAYPARKLLSSANKGGWDCDEYSEEPRFISTVRIPPRGAQQTAGVHTDYVPST